MREHGADPLFLGCVVALFANQICPTGDPSLAWYISCFRQLLPSACLYGV